MHCLRKFTLIRQDAKTKVRACANQGVTRKYEPRDSPWIMPFNIAMIMAGNLCYLWWLMMTGVKPNKLQNWTKKFLNANTDYYFFDWHGDDCYSKSMMQNRSFVQCLTRVYSLWFLQYNYHNFEHLYTGYSSYCQWICDKMLWTWFSMILWLCDICDIGFVFGLWHV